MKKKTRFRRCIALIVFAFVLLMTANITYAAGQSSANYQILTDVISGGGGDAGSINYDTEHTTGQPSAIGESSSSSYKNYAGFWYMFYTGAQGQLLGDINKDGIIDISDVILVLRIALKIDPVQPCSDLNNDGIVDISDVILTLRMALGLDPLKQCT